jgi:hypothetical protein
MSRSRPAIFRFFTGCGFATYLALASLSAPQQPAAKTSPPRPIETTTSLVLVDTLVQDKKNLLPVDDLLQDDFVLTDNGKHVDVSTFARGKDQKLRPVQLWFVLTCNQELHFQVRGGRRNSQYDNTEHWGVSFLAGKTTLLSPALVHLRPDEAVGVAHWCANGESEIDVAPSLDRAAALAAMERIAQRPNVVVQDVENLEPIRAGLIRLINNIASTAFPQPFLAIIYLGGKQAQDPNSKTTSDAWSGSMQVSSMNSGGEDSNSQSDSESLGFAVHSASFADRLGVYLDSLHKRYEFGFVPEKDRKKLHHINVSFTRAARQEYPDAALSYRDLYMSDQPAAPEKARHALDWKDLDSRMRDAVKFPAAPNQVSLEAQKTVSGEHVTQLLLRIAPADLTWETLPNGDRRCVILTVVASYSAKLQPTGLTVKELEIVQQSDKLPALRDKRVVLSLKAAEVKDAAKLRVLVRDVASGRIGSQDLSLATDASLKQ